MSKNHNGSVVVTGEERKHPAIRSLARACIALARLRLEREATAKKPDNDTAAGQAADRAEDAANG